MYATCKIDFKGDEVRKDRIQSILEANARQGEKMLWTNENSNIFVYLVGDGGQSFIALPNGERVTAEHLLESLFITHLQKLYKNLVIFADTPNAAGLFEMYQLGLEQ